MEASGYSQLSLPIDAQHHHHGRASTEVQQYLCSHVEGPELFHLYVGGIQNDKREAPLFHCLGKSLQQACPVRVCKKTIL